MKIKAHLARFFLFLFPSEHVISIQSGSRSSQNCAQGIMFWQVQVAPIPFAYVATAHQNMKLMMQSVKLGELTTSDGKSLQTYQHCISQAICNPPLPSCYLGKCNSCPLEEVLRSVLDDNLIDYVMFKQWVSVDRSTLDTFSKPADEFIEFFCDKLKLLIPHSFITAQQAY